MSPNDNVPPDGDGDWEDQFRRDLESIREGTRLYLSNDFGAAEALFRKGMLRGGGNGEGKGVADGEGGDYNPEDDDVGDGEDFRIDLRGAFGLQFAIVGLLRGVASMEDDQLDECTARLWEADALAARDAPWVGRKVVRGLCFLVAGVVECLRKSFVKGVLHMAKSWMWLRSLKVEALEYDGSGAEVVRSAALLALGVFALIVSLLPSSLTRAAKWTTGFDVKRSAGLEMLATCQREGGVWAPIAALAWIAFAVDTKAFLGELQTEEELEECQRLIDWAAPQFENSLFFAILEADLCAARRELPKALEVLDRSTKLACLDELRALKAMFYYKMALYHLAALDFQEAAAAYESSQQIYKEAGRRTLGPSMAMKAAQCYIISDGGGQSTNADAVKRMIKEVATYKGMDKSNWVGTDRQAFREYEEYQTFFGNDSKDEDSRRVSWSLLKLATGMTIVMRCTVWMTSDQASRLEEMLDGNGYERNPDDAALACMCVAQINYHQTNIDAGIERCKSGLSRSSELGEPSHKFGTVPMLHYLLAQFYHAKGKIPLAEKNLKMASELVTKDMALHHYLSFKTSQLDLLVKETIEETYETLNAPAGKKMELSIELHGSTNDATKTTVGWDWFLEGRDVDFGVNFFNKNGSGSADEVVQVTRHAAENGHMEGSFDLPAGHEGGVLRLTYSNEYSYFRGKVVRYKLALPPDTKILH